MILSSINLHDSYYYSEKSARLLLWKQRKENNLKNIKREKNKEYIVALHCYLNI